MDFNAFDEKELIGVFNDNLVDLLDQLETIVVSLTDQGYIDKRSKANLDFYKNLIDKALGFSIEIVIESFGSYILKDPNFVSKIMERDETFFINYSFTQDVSDRNLEELVNIIKGILGYLNDDNKGVIFDYLGILCQATVTYAHKKYI